MKAKILILSLIFIFINSIAIAEVTEDMKRRAKEAGVKIERDHDVKRVYLCNDLLSRDTHKNMQIAYRYAQIGDYDKVSELYLISANRGLDTAQIAMGKMYVHGSGVEPNIIEAYKFFKLSEDETSKNLYLKIRTEKMTQEQINEAEELVKNFEATYK